jgi:hypothetical protein
MVCGVAAGRPSTMMVVVGQDEVSLLGPMSRVLTIGHQHQQCNRLATNVKWFFFELHAIIWHKNYIYGIVSQAHPPIKRTKSNGCSLHSTYLILGEYLFTSYDMALEDLTMPCSQRTARKPW